MPPPGTQCHDGLFFRVFLSLPHPKNFGPHSRLNCCVPSNKNHLTSLSAGVGVFLFFIQRAHYTVKKCGGRGVRVTVCRFSVGAVTYLHQKLNLLPSGPSRKVLILYLLSQKPLIQFCIYFPKNHLFPDSSHFAIFSSLSVLLLFKDYLIFSKSPDLSAQNLIRFWCTGVNQCPHPIKGTFLNFF